MEDIIGILRFMIALYSYVGQTKSKDTFNSPEHVTQGEKNMLHNA